jgi:hypothetical protein
VPCVRRIGANSRRFSKEGASNGTTRTILAFLLDKRIIPWCDLFFIEIDDTLPVKNSGWVSGAESFAIFRGASWLNFVLRM